MMYSNGRGALKDLATMILLALLTAMSTVALVRCV